MSHRAQVVGTPEQIANRFVIWQDADVDGINIVNWRIPGVYDELIDHHLRRQHVLDGDQLAEVVPVLPDRGLVQRDDSPGPLRRKLFGHDLVNERHPAAG